MYTINFKATTTKQNKKRKRENEIKNFKAKEGKEEKRNKEENE